MSRLLRTVLPSLRVNSLRASATSTGDTKALIMAMRKETQLPLKNCREALVESNWDYEEAKVYLRKEAKRLGLKKMAKLASRSTTEGMVGGHLGDGKAAMIIVNCESEPVARTVEFNQFLSTMAHLLAQQPPGSYHEERLRELDSVSDLLAETIGLLQENIRVKKGLVVEGDNIGLHVRSKNADFPHNGTYASIVSLGGADAELARNLARHCILELPDKTGKLPKKPLDNDDVKDDEYRLYYQLLNGGNETVFNALQRHGAVLETWARFHISD